jgi:hypothetical protein
MLRLIGASLYYLGGCFCGVIFWIWLTALLSLPLSWLWPGYKAAEIFMDFTKPMMLTHLGISLFAALFSGFFSALFFYKNPKLPLVASIFLLLWQSTIHIPLGGDFPLWFDAWFLITLVPIFLIGARWGKGTLQ